MPSFRAIEMRFSSMKRAPFGYSLGRYVAQHLQLVFRPTDQCSECYGDRQTDHSRTGNTHTHGVLENVGTQQYLEPFGPTAQRLGGTGCTQRHRNRFGTTDRRGDFAFDQGDDLRRSCCDIITYIKLSVSSFVQR